MPPGDADSGDDGDDTASETDSLEIATADDFLLSEEDTQAAIDRVTFEWCRTVREAGERYRDGDSIPVIAVELDVPMMTVRKAVKTYYLVFAEPPVYDLRKHVFDNGRRYFQDGADLAELDTETQTEAEEHVREFVGRTLQENELDDVDIEGPVPDLTVPSFVISDGVEEQLFADIPDLEEQIEFPEPHMLFQDIDVFQEATALIGGSLARDMERIVDGLSAFPFREMDQASRATGVVLGAAGPAVASSVAASSAVAGGNPFVGPALDLPVMDGVAVLLEALPEITELLGVMPPSGVEALGPAGRVEPLLPVTDLVEQFAEQQYLVTQAVEPLNSLDLAPAGLSAMGAVTSHSNPFGGVEQSGVALPGEPRPRIVSESTHPVADQDTGLVVDVRWVRNQLPAVPPENILKVAAVLAPIFVDAVFFELQQMYPDQRVTLTRATFVTVALLELWLLQQISE